MTPNEKMKFLNCGDTVKLKPLNQVNRSEYPNIVDEMEKYFGYYVTIGDLKTIIHRDCYIFSYRGYNWNIEWIEESHFSHLPQELFEIE